MRGQEGERGRERGKDGVIEAAKSEKEGGIVRRRGINVEGGL